MQRLRRKRVAAMKTLRRELVLRQIWIDGLGATYSSSKVMNGLLVRGPSGALSSSRMLITLPRLGILNGLRRKHASPGYEYVPQLACKQCSCRAATTLLASKQQWHTLRTNWTPVNGRACPPLSASVAPVEIIRLPLTG